MMHKIYRYGEKLMTRAEEIARERGYTHIILETSSFQASEIGFCGEG